jgi:CIC family chloride channel protein
MGTMNGSRWERFRIAHHENTVLLVLTLIIGALVGAVVVAFILLTENLGGRMYPAGSAAWRRIFIPIVGSLTSGYFLYRYFPNARGSGIPQAKTALFVRDGFISLRTVIGKFSMCSLTLASGLALGREGPSVHVGAGIASVLGRRLGLSPASVKSLVPVGAAAALAAAFNTPIAAVLFTLEEVMGDMHAPVLGSIVLSSATSWMVLHLLLGDEPLFHVPAYELKSPVEFAAYAVLGLVGGIVSVAFVKLLLWQRKWFLSLPIRTRWFQPVAGGITVGLLGWFAPDVLGVGYGTVGQALNGHMVLGMMALLVCLKLVATATCYSSGNAGGIFGPALFIGAMLGGTVGSIAQLVMPSYAGNVGAYALVGMGAAFAGIIRVPLTSVIMIFEVTRDYTIIVPLMIANLLAYFVSSRLQEEPIYEALLQQDGIHLPSSAGERAKEAVLRVSDALRPGGEPLSTSLTVAEARVHADPRHKAWPVADEQGLRGMVSAQRLDRAIATGQGGELLGKLVPEPGPVEALSQDAFPHLHADHTLDVALRRIAETGWDVLPVVSRDNIRQWKGTLCLSDILGAYGVSTPQSQAKPDQAEHQQT